MDKSAEQTGLFASAYQVHLIELLDIDTTTPMETLRGSDIKKANEYFATLASGLGFEILVMAEPEVQIENIPHLPHRVREVMDVMSEDFYRTQNNLLLRLGYERPRARTLMFNFHMDTVSPHLPVSCENGIVRGRGAVDAKGLGLAILCGIEKALHKHPDLADQISILLQSVCGEEGGAMGFYGSRALANQSGVLNVVAEPTGNKALDQSTTSMTAKIVVGGNSSTDDAPQAAVNASVILGAIAYELAKSLDAKVAELNSKICIAGVHTGHLHNRVYGQGTLMINMAYRSSSVARKLKQLLEKSFNNAKQSVALSLKNSYFFAKTSAAIASHCTLTWTKYGLPVLNNRHGCMEALLHSVGVERETDASRAFTCDAMWFQQPNSYTIILGPGDLGENGAHTDDEHIELAELEAYSEKICAIIGAFYLQTKCEKNA